MIPGKIFLQSINCSQDLSLKCKFHLIMNDLFYDELKVFQNKYLCLTANDHLAVQLILCKDKKSVQNQTKSTGSQESETDYQCYAAATISNAYKLILQNKTIQICYKLESIKESVKISLVFEPVASFNRKKLGALGNTSKINNIFNDSSPSSRDRMENLYGQLSSSRNALKQSLCNYRPLGESNYLKNSSRWSKFDQNLIQQESSGQQNYKSSAQGQSLQSLAYQRQKILGELFTKFKK